MKQNSKIHIRDFPKEKKWVFCDNHIQRSLVKLGYSAINAEYSISFKIINKLLIGFIFSLLKVTYYYFLQFLFVQKKELKNKKAIFLKSGNGYDYANLYRVVDFDESKVVYINSFTMKSYMGVIKVNFPTLIKNFVRSVVVYRSVIKEPFPSNIGHLIARNGLKNIARYVYLLSFFKSVKSINKNIEMYSGGALLASNAAIDVGIKTFYLTHGNIGAVHPISFPNFDGVYVYSSDEKKYLNKVVANINVFIYPFIKVESHNNLIIVFMRLNDDQMDFNELKDLVYFFKHNHYIVKFKPHPQYNDNNLYTWAMALGVDIIGKEKGSASSLIDLYSPSFVVAWQSTALSEAINMGVIPISLSNKSEVLSCKSIYQLNKRVLFWNRDKKYIIKIINQQVPYSKVLRNLSS